MNCPEHLILKRERIYIWHIQSADVRREYISVWEKVNPLRYEICINPATRKARIFNEDAKLWRTWRNFWFRVRKSLNP